ncbi:MAG TPA: AraC family transcriptional regulator ligand-binding domain-containing protein, partial [Polyangiaceae bacterium]
MNVLNALFAYAQSRGFDRSSVLAAGGLTAAALTSADERLPVSVLYSVHRALDALTRDDSWGLSVVDALPKGSYGIAEYIFRCQPSLVDSLHAIVRYSCLLSEVSQLRLRTLPSGVVFEAVHVDPDVHGHTLHRSLYQNLLSGIMHIAREITTPALSPYRVTLPFSPPASDSDALSKYRAVFGSIPEFETTPAALYFDAAALATPVQAADPNLSSILQTHADELLARARGHDEFVNQVRRVMLRQL